MLDSNSFLNQWTDPSGFPGSDEIRWSNSGERLVTEVELATTKDDQSAMGLSRETWKKPSAPLGNSSVSPSTGKHTNVNPSNFLVNDEYAIFKKMCLENGSKQLGCLFVKSLRVWTQSGRSLGTSNANIGAIYR